MPDSANVLVQDLAYCSFFNTCTCSFCFSLTIESHHITRAWLGK
jgi:hypothetical protein